jgi:hypothetical protein
LTQYNIFPAIDYLIIKNKILMLLNQRPPAELGYEDGHWKGPGPPLLVAADLMKKNFG